MLETKEQPKQWTSPDKRAPKTKTVPSVRKIMAIVFWDAHGILLFDYLDKGRTITGEYYWTNVMMQSRKNIPIWQRKKCSFIRTTH